MQPLTPSRIFGDSNRMLDVWPRYSVSPILTEFRWSELIEEAFDANRELITASDAHLPLLASIPPSVASAARYTVIPGLLAMHIRRGDYAAHCQRLARWHAKYTAFNSFPEFPDKLADVPDDVEGDARVPLVRPHCWPSIPEIVARAEEERMTPEGAGLTDVFILTNGDREWVRELTEALRATGTWRVIATGRDLYLSKEQRYVSQAVDMLIWQRAEVLIGNGVCGYHLLLCLRVPWLIRDSQFSSMTSQMNLLRMANGLFPQFVSALVISVASFILLCDILLSSFLRHSTRAPNRMDFLIDTGVNHDTAWSDNIAASARYPEACLTVHWRKHRSAVEGCEHLCQRL